MTEPRPSDDHRPLFPRKPHAITVEALAAIQTVTLAAGDLPPGILRQFYTQHLGLVYRGADETVLRFSYHTRQVHLDRRQKSPGHLAMLVRQFSEALLRLREGRISHELFHSDSGLTRTALLRDPAGNWVHLLETRLF